MRPIHRLEYGLKLLTFTLIFSMNPSVHATEFYTLIGPDGRPMVVQQKRVENKSKAVENKTQFSTPTYTTADAEKEAIHSNGMRAIDKPHLNLEQDAQQKLKLQHAEVAPKEPPSKADPSNSFTPKGSDHPVEKAEQSQIPVEPLEPHHPIHSTDQERAHVNQHPEPLLDTKPLRDDPKKNTGSKTVSSSSKQTDSSALKAVGLTDRQDKAFNQNSDSLSQAEGLQSERFTEIDGVQYVDNEFLEEREFNLEGRKRFYLMPDGAATGGRFETVQREKGITKSLLDKFSNQGLEQQKPIVLATSYHRLAKDDLVDTLEQSCFAGKKLDKAKTMGQNNTEMGFWPVAPFKEKFVYEVVKFESTVKNIHFMSYASSQNKPTYYWPLVVFLDQKGCVLEGVSGFKNQDVHQNKFQHSALEGVLKIPENAVFMIMTPLAESIDVPELELSNQGQIKLRVLL